MNYWVQTPEIFTQIGFEAKNFQFDHYSLFRGRKPSKTWLQRESLTLEINDIICDHQVSDHYTTNSTESLYSRYSQRYSGSTARLSFAERLSIAERPFSRGKCPQWRLVNFF
ncbi:MULTISPECIES: hypothetical protein [Microcystis]|uniref:hypothetical protein n=1 Tax=Microcystis TaxID=1125 RepID=UPI001F54F10D|nr:MULTISPECIES: hypothetical protein [Microcystis]UZO74291.1 hypothetical protein M8120_15380 [Microcystis aeruginosa str. Chao 1910]